MAVYLRVVPLKVALLLESLVASSADELRQFTTLDDLVACQAALVLVRPIALVARKWFR